jgi:hypothetical protein
LDQSEINSLRQKIELIKNDGEAELRIRLRKIKEEDDLFVKTFMEGTFLEILIDFFSRGSTLRVICQNETITNCELIVEAINDLKLPYLYAKVGNICGIVEGLTICRYPFPS